MGSPRFPDGWNWDETSGHNGAWLYFRDGQYLAWVEPKHGVFVANWRVDDGPPPRQWAYPWGEDPEHIHTNPYKAMQHAQSKAT